MASKEYGRDPKAKLNSNKAHGEDAMQKSRMGDALKESLEQIQNKDSRERWLFGKKQIENTPSRRDNISAEKELNYRQQAANLIQDMGQRLPVNQLTINTAIVYMHRFYMFHSFQAFSRFVMAPTALFLAAKVEEQPRKLEHVIKVCHSCLHPDKPHIDVHSDGYMKQAQELVQNELIMLQTLGFDISIDHPHTHVVKCTQLVKASRDLSQMAYFMATNSLHLTTFCLQYKPTVVSAMCIHLSCKWSNYEIPLSSTGKAYWTYMDPIITESLLESIINEFLKILNLCPTRLRKLRNYKPSQHLRDSSGGSAPSTSKDGQQGKPSSTSSSRVSHGLRLPSGQPPEVPPAANPSANDQMKKHPSMTLAEYKKREKIQLGKQPSTQQEKEIKQEKQHKYNSPHSHPSQRKVPHQVTSASRPNHGNPHSEGQHSRHHIPPPGPQHSQNKAKPHPNTSEHNRSHDRTPQQSTQSAKPDKPGLGIPGLKRTTDQRQHQVSNTSHTMQKHNAHEHKSAKEQSNASTSHHSSTGTSHPRNHEQHVKAMQRLKEEKLQPQEHTGSNSPAVSVAEDENAMMKGIEMKIMEQMKAEKSVMKFQTEGSASLSVPTSNIPGIKHPSQSSANHHTPAVTKEHRGRHSHPGHPSQEKQAPSTSHHSMSFSDVKSPGEHKKNPHTMYHYLKQKMQAGPLSAEEKNLLHKLKKKEEERRRKREHKKQKSHHTQPSSEQGGSAEGSSTPSGGGSLTVRIKLPPSSRPVGSSSGSGSEAALEHSPGGTVLPKPGRKRAHGHDSSMDPTLVKQSRKSESHHHQGQSSSQGNASRHKHSRSSSHHQQSKAQQQAGQKIDEAVFQQALVDAVSMVQSGHAGSGNSGNGSASGRVVPTVTLKRTSAHNGSDDNYIAHSSKQEKRRSSSKRSKHSNFDPSTPISATLPEDLFDQEDDESNHQHFDRKCTSGSNRNAADLSSPETGEIRDDEDESVSPLREHVASSLPSSKDWGNTQRKRTANNVSPHYRHRNSAAEFQPRGSDAGYPSESKGCDRVTPLTVKSSYLNETR